MRQAKINPAAVLMIALPLFAVLASVGTTVVAVSRGDPPLPGQYHWEGDKLDHDFAQSERAAQLHLNATLNLLPDAGERCYLTLILDGNRAPDSVALALIHVSNPALDRSIRFTRTSRPSQYSAPCSPLPTARWHLELSDPDGSWSFRTATSGEQPATVTLSSSSPADDSAWP
jgi:hypothetical protein